MHFHASQTVENTTKRLTNHMPFNYYLLLVLVMVKWEDKVYQLGPKLLFTKPIFHILTQNKCKLALNFIFVSLVFSSF